MSSEMEAVRDNRDQMQSTYIAESEELKAQVQMLQTQLNQVFIDIAINSTFMVHYIT